MANFSIVAVVVAVLVGDMYFLIDINWKNKLYREQDKHLPWTLDNLFTSFLVVVVS